VVELPTTKTISAGKIQATKGLIQIPNTQITLSGWSIETKCRLVILTKKKQKNEKY
jgi:hypothetical protein